MAEFVHTPVLLDEALAALAVSDGNRSDGYYIDATFGRGGHSAAILQRLSSAGRLIALDRDTAAISVGKVMFAGDVRLQLVHSDFGQLRQAVQTVVRDETRSSGGFTGILFDFGVSSPQLDDASRGFSFMHDGPLDMRMDTSRGMTAADWLQRVAEHELQQVIREYGEEKFFRRIAGAIIAARNEAPITTTAQLAAIVAKAVPTREPGKNPATRTFQAIRIHINSELEQIKSALTQALDLLAPGGRLAVISFHSLEDRIAKEFIQRHSQEDPVYAGLPDIPPHARPQLRKLRGAIHASDAEVARNPRSRSAILRAAERVAA
jgi:16S rRNA (cytosine1402-N4)-methyltransferase